MSLVYWPSPSEFSVLRPRRRAARPLVQPPGSRKPLHLDGRQRAIDVRAAGPALAIRRGDDLQHLPLARIARVIVRGRVHWDAAAFVLCFQQRVPIVFVDALGDPAGAALPVVAHTGAADELICALLERDDWRQHYDDWLRSQKLRLLLHWRQQRALAAHPVGQDEWREKVRSFVYLGEARVAGARADAAYALVVDVLLRAGLRTCYRAADGGTLALANDLAGLLHERIGLESGTFAALIERHGVLAARAAAAAGAEHERYVIHLLKRLRRCVAELIEPWP